MHSTFVFKKLTTHIFELANFDSQLELATRKFQLATRKINSRTTTRNSQNQLAHYNSQLAKSTRNYQLVTHRLSKPPQTIIPIQVTLLACIIAHMSHQSFSKAVVSHNSCEGFVHASTH